MELLDGDPLRRFVGDDAIPLAKRIGWLEDVARALGAAHEAGLVHRDVKPDNVIVTRGGPAKLLDFGIARPAPTPIDPTAPTTRDQATSLTKTGAIVGSPFYIAPEQLRGDPADPRSDQFAWGVTAYELLSGELPWGLEATSFALAARMMNEDAPDLRRHAAIDERVARVVMRSLARDPADRFPSMAAVVGALAGHPFDTGDAVPNGSGTSSSGEQAARGKTSSVATTERRPVPWTAIAIAAAVVVVGVFTIRSILKDAKVGPSRVEKSNEPILGLSDSATKQRDRDLHTPVPKNPQASQAAARKCKDSSICSKDNAAWCAADGRHLACCAAGLVGNAAGRCECAPGGTLSQALIDGGCKQGEPKRAEPIQKIVRARFDAFRACYEKALEKNPKVSGKVTLRFDIATDGSTYDTGLAGASVPDPVFQDCLVEEVSKLRFDAPLDGHGSVVYPIDFSPGAPQK
jgi:hypothetical protein